jgi:hypothetical protein
MTGGALAAWWAAWRVVFLPISVGLLGISYYGVYTQNHSNRRQRIILWMATPLTVLFWVLPYVSI